ncbi:hypothetical protein [Anaplasma marginale]|uniref:hypothetical protein n=1 Tax=Anaplasma marginale TaxID=770 RepID=UPI0002E8E2B2|nr:hypothetical protein [Anaplasma marginale]
MNCGRNRATERHNPDPKYITQKISATFRSADDCRFGFIDERSTKKWALGHPTASKSRG